MLLDHLRTRWPAEDLEYLRLIATTILALVLLPLALTRLLHNPVEAVDHTLAAAAEGKR